MINWIPFFSYVFINTFSPGPNNLMSTAVGGQYGYRKALSFISGVFLGVLTIILLCTFFIERVYSYFPGVETLLKYLGTGYILWLALQVLQSKTTDVENNRGSFSLNEGFLMQFANPKVIIYGITVTSSFIIPNVKSPQLLVAASIFLAFTAFLSTFSWAVMGALYYKYLSKQRFKKVFNSVMALLLIYCALYIAGIL